MRNSAPSWPNEMTCSIDNWLVASVAIAMACCATGCGCSSSVERAERLRHENLKLEFAVRQQKEAAASASWQREQERREFERQRAEEEWRKTGIEDWGRVKRENQAKRIEVVRAVREGRKRIEAEIRAKRRAEVERKLSDSAEQTRRLKSAGTEFDRSEDELRAFALSESPRLWETLQELRASADVQNDALENLRLSFAARGLSPKGDKEFEKVRSCRNVLVRNVLLVEDRLTEAFVMACKFRATPTKTEFESACRKALREGVAEAERARRQFKSMQEEK